MYLRAVRPQASLRTRRGSEEGELLFLLRFGRINRHHSPLNLRDSSRSRLALCSSVNMRRAARVGPAQLKRRRGHLVDHLLLEIVGHRLIPILPLVDHRRGGQRAQAHRLSDPGHFSHLASRSA
jgi:hypothetical protein